MAEGSAEEGGGSGSTYKSDEIAIKLCLEYYCHIFCKKFLESGLGSNDLNSARTYISIIHSIIDLGVRTQTSMGNSLSPKLIEQSHHDPVDSDSLQSYIVLAIFCFKIWNKDLEVDEDEGPLKTLVHYIEALFDLLSQKLAATDTKETVAHRNKRKEFMIKYVNSQRILMKNGDNANKKEVISLFDEWNKENLVLYPREVKRLVLYPHLEVPNFIHYASFLQAMKQLAQDVLSILETPCLARVQSVLHAVKSKKNMHSLSFDMTLCELLDGSTESTSLIEKEQSSVEDRAEPSMVESVGDCMCEPETVNVGEIQDDVVKEDSPVDDVKVVKKLKKRTSRIRKKFTSAEEDWLRQGIERFGTGQWKVILANYPFHNRTPVNLKDKYRNLLRNNDL